MRRPILEPEKLPNAYRSFFCGLEQRWFLHARYNYVNSDEGNHREDTVGDAILISELRYSEEDGGCMIDRRSVRHPIDDGISLTCSVELIYPENGVPSDIRVKGGWVYTNTFMCPSFPFYYDHETSTARIGEPDREMTDWEVDFWQSFAPTIIKLTNGLTSPDPELYRHFKEFCEEGYPDRVDQ